MTGLSASGKTTLGRSLCDHLQTQGYSAEFFDSDQLRAQISAGLWFSEADRGEHVRRIGKLARERALAGCMVIVAAMSPSANSRAEVRKLYPRFFEVYVNAAIEMCERRDTKGLYTNARAGLIRDLPGIDMPYEAPVNPEVECRTDLQTVEESLRKILERLGPLLRPVPVLD